MLAAIVGFFQALPQLLSMVQSLMGWINKISGNDPVGYLNKASQAFDQLHQAKTEKETADAAQAIQNLIRGIH